MPSINKEPNSNTTDLDSSSERSSVFSVVCSNTTSAKKLKFFMFRISRPQIQSYPYFYVLSGISNFVHFQICQKSCKNRLFYSVICRLLNRMVWYSVPGVVI